MTMDQNIVDFVMISAARDVGTSSGQRTSLSPITELLVTANQNKAY